MERSRDWPRSYLAFRFYSGQCYQFTSRTGQVFHMPMLSSPAQLSGHMSHGMSLLEVKLLLQEGF